LITSFTGCALSRLHSQPLMFSSIRSGKSGKNVTQKTARYEVVSERAQGAVGQMVEW
jgi:hypothetical protein